jgi:hypothetical protein
MYRCSKSILVALALATTAGTAASQLTLPPTSAKPERPAYVPPAERAQQQQQATEDATPPKSTFDPSSVEFEPVYTTADDGTITGPIEHYEIAALRNNPLIDEDLWEFLDLLLEDRAQEMEVVTHVYPRQCIDAVTTVIPAFDVRDESTRTPLGDITNVINQPMGLIAWLDTQGVITEDMQMMSHHIATDYTQVMMADIKANAPDGLEELEIVNLQAHFLVRQGLAEPLRGFGRLARRVIEAHPEVVKNPNELLVLKGDKFVDEAAKALAPLEDIVLTQLFLEAHENN